jgi:hypothetical protein
MHYFDNLFQQRPFPVILDVPSYIAGMDKVKAGADSLAHIVPGHDPLVLQSYPAVSPGMEGLAVRLDVMPTKAPKP